MKTKEIRISYTEYAHIDELPGNDRVLVLRAREASADAYTPYSGFRVGAAVLLENGEIITGNNQENAAFPSGLCAERVALFHANATFPGSPVDTMAVTAQNESGFVKEPVKPCGGCRQVMLETETRFGKPVRIILDGTDKIIVLKDVESLMPLSFRSFR